MAPPRRTAERRTAAAIAEDLRQARFVGGLHRASEQDLAGTFDLVQLAGLAADEEPLRRARDLLISHVSRGCEAHRRQHSGDPAAQAAASSLQTLLLRPATNRRKAEVVRRAAGGPRIQPDSIRKREDRLIETLAVGILAALQVARSDEPRSVEAAIHNLVPLAADLRQRLHDLLCLTYDDLPAADPHEEEVIESRTRQSIVQLGDLLLAAARVAQLARHSANVTEAEEVIVRHARHMIGFLFDQDADDRQFMLDFMRADETDTRDERLASLLASAQGQAVFERSRGWLRSCFPTCKFERSTDILGMCSPHALLTLLYDTEVSYSRMGFSELDIAGRLPLVHHGVVQLEPVVVTGATGLRSLSS